MHSHPAKHSTTVAINALWCLLIALILLAFPIVARQARLQTVFSQTPAHAEPAAKEHAVPPAPAPILISQTETLAAQH